MNQIKSRAGYAGYGRSRSRGRAEDEAAKREKPKHSARSYVLWLLKDRDYSATSLRTKLIRRGYGEEEADEALAFAKENGYQSDERLAASTARNRSARQGNKGILWKLKEKGIPEDVARSQVETLDGEEGRAIEVVQKFKPLVDKEGMTQSVRGKIYRFLAGRGFSLDSIKAAISSLGVGGSDDFLDE